MKNQLHPIWFRLPRGFYKKLEISAQASGWEPEHVLEYGVDLFGKLLAIAHQSELDVKVLVAELIRHVRNLEKAADVAELPLSDALEQAVKLLRIYGPVTAPVPKHGEEARKTPSALAILRWAKVPPQERQQRAKELALKRWNSPKPTQPKSAGKAEK